jgi:hypothetical protein
MVLSSGRSRARYDPTPRVATTPAKKPAAKKPARKPTAKKAASK